MRSEHLNIHFETLGCKVNQIESESVARNFSDEGFTCTMGGLTSASNVDNHTVICVLNTCTVTAKAEQKARRLIRLLLEKYPKSCLIVTGCYAELEKALIENIDTRICVLKGTQKDLLAELPKEIEAYFTKQSVLSFDAINLASHISSYFDKSIKTYSFLHKKKAFALSTDTFMQHSRSSIKVQDGCNFRCAYCRICLARGESISLGHEEVLKRVLLLEKALHSEVTITGISLSQYKSSDMDFAGLLAYLLKHTNKINFRISSLHPQSVTDELCVSLAHERVRPHFHLSIQSGSDTILKAMARPYKAEQIQKAIRKLAAIKDNPFIACDIIVGFPGETEEDFDCTKSLCEKENLTWIHAFPFSPRPDTPAFTMNPKVPTAVSNERVKILTNIAIQNKKNYITNCVGKTFKGVVEKFRKTDIHVVTENFLHVKVKPSSVTVLPESLGGKEVLIQIEGSDKKDLRQAEGEAFGKIVQIFS